MALGLGKKSAGSINYGGGITLASLLNNTDGFPQNYIPKMRAVDGTIYIRTYASGHDADMTPVFFKWIFIDPKDNSATPDSLSEYARIPERGFIMRIMQRSLLPYHENFVIDYYEDVNNLSIVSLDAESKEQFQNKMEGIYRTFRIGDYAVPEDLKTEIYTYPDIFFKTYIQDAIPPELFFNGKMHESNKISSYTPRIGTNIDMGIMSHGLNVPNRPTSPKPQAPRGYQSISRGNNPNAGLSRPGLSRNNAAVQQTINRQIRSQYNAYGAPANGNKLGSTGQNPSSKSFYDAGFRYMQ